MSDEARAVDVPSGTFELDEVRRLDLSPGDTLMITVAAKMPSSAWKEATRMIKEWHPDVHVLVVPPGTRADVFRNEATAT